jgi:hypothetical protein
MNISKISTVSRIFHGSMLFIFQDKWHCQFSDTCSKHKTGKLNQCRGDSNVSYYNLIITKDNMIFDTIHKQQCLNFLLLPRKQISSRKRKKLLQKSRNFLLALTSRKIKGQEKRIRHQNRHQIIQTIKT